MYPVHPKNRNHKLLLISFDEAVDHLPKRSKKPKKTTNQKRVGSRPVPISAKNNFSAFTAPLVPKDFKPMPKTQSKTRNTAKHQVTKKRDPSDQERERKAFQKTPLKIEQEANGRGWRIHVDALLPMNTSLPGELPLELKPIKETDTTQGGFSTHKKALEKERESARNSLLKLEKEADGRDNHQLFKELEKLCGCHLAPLPGELPYLQLQFGLKLKPTKETDTTQGGFSTHKKALEKERESARNSLLKLEKEADGRDNHQLFKELEKLCGRHLAPLPGELPYLQRQFGLKLKPTKETETTQDGFSSCKRALEKEREAAWNSLLKLEKEVDGRDHHQHFKELEKLCGCHLAPLPGELPYLQRQFGLKLKPIKETETTQDGFSSCKRALEKEREAARNSLLKLEKEADGRDNHQLFKELEELCGCHLAYAYASLSGKLPYLQHHFGLKLKPVTKTKEKAGANLDHSLSDKRVASASYKESPPYENDKEKAATALHYEKLMAWMPPSSSSHNDELDDWLFKPKQPAAKRQKFKSEDNDYVSSCLQQQPPPAKRQKFKSEDDDYVSSCLQQQPPRARFLAEAQIYALPYKLPF